MPQYLIASYLPDDFDPSVITEETIAGIHALNDEMEAAGALKFACGVSPASSAKTLRKHSDGKISVTDGPFTEAKEHIGGLLLIEAANLDEALAWVRKGSAHMLAPVEVREIFFQADPKHATSA